MNHEDLPGAGLLSIKIPSGTFALSRREIGFIGAFWGVSAFLMIASRVFDSTDPRLTLTSGYILVPLVNCAAWAATTPLVFWLTAQSGAEGRPRPVQLTLLLALGVGISLLLGIAVQHLLAAFIPPPPRAPEGGDGLPLWIVFINGLVVYFAILAAGFARVYSLGYRARRQQAAELQARLTEAHLEALRRQLDPHFLFNTLNAVSSLVERDPRGVRRMIARLSELLRYSLDRQDGPEIPLGKELELLGQYLEIMQVRFQGRLEVQQALGEGVLDALVPTMVLQPLVENAIKHGVEQLDGVGRITIEAMTDNGSLLLRVSDNGPDMVAHARPSSARNGGGVGLRNTMARLEQLYGERQGFTLRPLPTGGMVAEVRIPFRLSNGE